jgi:hypothetical protein
LTSRTRAATSAANPCSASAAPIALAVQSRAVSNVRFARARAARDAADRDQRARLVDEDVDLVAEDFDAVDAIAEARDRSAVREALDVAGRSASTCAALMPYFARRS